MINIAAVCPPQPVDNGEGPTEYLTHGEIFILKCNDGYQPKDSQVTCLMRQYRPPLLCQLSMSDINTFLHGLLIMTVFKVIVLGFV